MATNFFEHQATARRLTLRLVALFVLAVVSIMATVCVVVWLLLGGMATYAEAPEGYQPVGDPKVYLVVAAATLGIIVLGSLFKIAALAQGGRAVAEMLGGQLINPQTTDLAERRLLNVVEEMAIASGLAVPPVYLMPGEAGINAFAAGFRPDQAVIGVTRGSIDNLSRDEMQGVIAHEFSHILNGDMRLNLRLIGLLHGILVIALLGFYLIRAMSFSNRSRRDDRDGRGAMALMLFGLALAVIGYLGVFFGRLIKSAVSRQREYLADASAVQFTRNPEGIAGALKKIGGLSTGSRINDAHAEEASHMFFGNAVRGAMFSLLATHPPLSERIRRIDPNWDGQYPRTESLAPPVDEPARPLPRRATAHAAAAALAGGLAVDSAEDLQQLRRRAKQRQLVTADAQERVGQPAPPEVDYARVLVPTYPEAVRSAADEPHGARAVVLALLLEPRPDIRTKQQELIAARLDEPTRRELSQLLPLVDSLPPDARLPLAELCLRALKNLSPAQYRTFRELLQGVVQADAQVSLFEYLLWVIVVRALDILFVLKQVPRASYHRVQAVAEPTSVVLAMLAIAGHDDRAEAEQAWAAAYAALRQPAPAGALREVALAQFDAALEQLERADPEVKQQIVAACVACTGSDGRATVAESEILRAVCSVLDCPMPPLLPTTTAAT